MSTNTLKSWFPVAALGLGAFVFVTSELMPVGLLPEISEGLNKSESTTGLLMTGYAWLVALISLPLTLLTAKVERKKLLIGLLCFFSLGNLLAGFAANYGMMLLARALVAVGHSVFWAITPPLAARLAPEGRYTTGLATVSAGVTLSTVLGMPLGTFMGHHFGWRISFMIVSAVGVLIILVLLAILPKIPSMNAGSVKSLPSLAKNKVLIACYAVTLLIVTGHFTPYTFLVPYLSKVVDVQDKTIVILLLVFGASALPGIYTAGKLVDKRMRGLLLGFGAIFVLSLSGIYFVNASVPGTVALMILWSMSMSVAGITFQVWVLKAAPHAVDAAMAVQSGIFNVGIGLGAVLGGVAFDHIGAAYLGFSGAVFIIPALALIFVFAKVK
jgi:predicted MFS family arabinose efflux permease